METAEKKMVKNVNEKRQLKRTMLVLKILFCVFFILPFISVAVSTPVLRAIPSINDEEIFGKGFIIIVSMFAVSALGMSALGCVAAFVKKKLKIFSVIGMICAAIGSTVIIIFNFCLISTDVLLDFFKTILQIEIAFFIVAALCGYICFVWQFDTKNIAVSIMQIIVTVGTFFCLPAAVLIEQSVMEITKLLPVTVIIIFLCVVGLIFISEIAKRKSTSEK